MTISEKSTHRKLAAYNYQFIMVRVKLDHIKIKNIYNENTLTFEKEQYFYSFLHLDI